MMNINTVIGSPEKNYLKDAKPSGISRQKDICMAVLLSNPYNFAALFNLLDIFDEKILPEDLEEMDSRISTLRFATFEEMVKKGQTLYRDILKLWHGKIRVFLGIESQSQAVPTMAIRSMNYDGANYDKQANAIGAYHTQEWKDGDNHFRVPEGLTSGEFLDKFTKEDHLIPIRTAVLFIGDEWDCARNLNELFKNPDGFMKDIPAWPVYIIDPHVMRDEEIMNMDNNDMKFFMTVVKYSKDKKKMKELIKTRFKDVYISPQMGYITGVVTNTKWLEELFKERRDEWKEDENMCLAFEEWEKEARTEGIVIGEKKGVNEERKRIIHSLLAKGSSLTEIANILAIDKKEVEEIVRLLKA